MAGFKTVGLFWTISSDPNYTLIGLVLNSWWQSPRAIIIYQTAPIKQSSSDYLVDFRLPGVGLDIDGVDPAASQRRNDQPVSGQVRVVEAAGASVPT